jgi:hypothetical protein
VGAGKRLPVGCRRDYYSIIARATQGPIDAPLGVGTWTCLGGCGSTAARVMSLRCAQAAGGGHLEVLRRLREHECPWESSRVTEPLGAGTWMYFNGRGMTTARATIGQPERPLQF